MNFSPSYKGLVVSVNNAFAKSCDLKTASQTFHHNSATTFLFNGHNPTSTTMARLSITGDSDLIEDQIQREAETHEDINSSPEKKKRRRSRLGKKTEEHHRGIFQDNVSSKDIDLEHDESMGFIIERDPLESSPSKKRKRNRHRDQSKLYEVPGVENLPAKRKTSYRVAQDLAADAIRGDSSDEPATAVHSKNASSYPEANPFMSPPKSLVQHASAANTSLKLPYAQKARLDTILKSCSRKTVEDAALDDLALNKESDGSPSPPVKAEHEAQTISFRDIVRACDGKHGRRAFDEKPQWPDLAGQWGQDLFGRYPVEINSRNGKKPEIGPDKLAKKITGKEENTTTRMKPLAANAPTELSAPATILPTVKSKHPDHDDEVERDSSASPVVVRPSLPPRSPKPIKPAVGNITGAKASYGSAMEEWEVSPGIVRAAVSTIKSGGHEVAYSAHHIRTNPSVTEFANTSFAIHTILGGRSFGFPLETFVRVCYVVSGKLQVQVDGAGFAIGKGGMWRITSLGSCVVGNRSYEDAIIHVTSIRIERDLV
ncbi:hypothetical protein V496_02840 [Pseudogymnoascus sp. VKM F-4515 (FW-2607)]|nr:hypothetical protein V496_02840 [Pseudogymnoascus sp. VKM F-4515 (FW-2607)]